MPSAQTLERFIARVESNAHVEAIEEFYTEDASMRENFAPPRVGRDKLVAHGAHHAAQKSTRTGTSRERAMTSASKADSFTSLTAGAAASAMDAMYCPSGLRATALFARCRHIRRTSPASGVWGQDIGYREGTGHRLQVWVQVASLVLGSWARGISRLGPWNGAESRSKSPMSRL